MTRLFARSAISKLPGRTPGSAVGGATGVAAALAGGGGSASACSAALIEVGWVVDPEHAVSATRIGARKARTIADRGGTFRGSIGVKPRLPRWPPGINVRKPMNTALPQKEGAKS